jgi:hypothetical protein
MATLREIRLGLADALKPIGGLQTTGYMLSNPTPPAAEITPAGVEYHGAMSAGLTRWSFIVRGFVAFASDLGAQERLDRWFEPTGAESFIEALEADPSLGGLVEDVTVRGVSNYGLFLREGAGPMLGAEWAVEVMAAD